MRGFGKQGISDVVAVVLIIMITVAAIAIVWLAIIPLVSNNLSLSCTDVDLSIGTEGFTCYVPSNVTAVQVNKGPNNVNVIGVKMLLESGGNSQSYMYNYNFQSNSRKTFYLDSSNLNSIDKIGLVAYYEEGKTQKECPAVYLESPPNCASGFMLPAQAILSNQTNATSLSSSNSSCAVNGTSLSGNISLICNNSAYYTDNCGGTHQGLLLPNCTCSSSTPVGQNCSDGCGGSCTGTHARDGSINFPYTISNWTDLNQVRSFTSSYFVLNNNLTLSTAGYNGLGNSWTAIPSFTGLFDGNGYTISDLTNLTVVADGGLFGQGFSGTIENLTMRNETIMGQLRIGGLVSDGSGTIINCGVQGTFTQTSTMNSGKAGGIYGYMEGGTLSNSWANVTVTSYELSGGLVGECLNTLTIQNSYSIGAISGGAGIGIYIGGLVGLYQGGGTINIYNSWSGANVIGGSHVGGFIGGLGNSNIQNCYSYGSVSGSGGGFVGYSSSAPGLTNCYWDMNTSNQNTSYNGVAIGLNDTQMKQQVSYSGWDFTNAWAINSAKNNGYPYLKWQNL